MTMKQKTMQVQKTAPSPTLDTILMVEEALQDAPNSLTTVAELKRLLPRQVNHNTLMVVLDYLDRSGKIIVGVRGIVWAYNPSPKLRKAIERGMEV